MLSDEARDSDLPPWCLILQIPQRSLVTFISAAPAPIRSLDCHLTQGELHLDESGVCVLGRGGGCVCAQVSGSDMKN